MIEEESQGMHGEPEQETKPWLSKLAQVESKRSRFRIWPPRAILPSTS
jgi:hypothetical protein